MRTSAVADSRSRFNCEHRVLGFFGSPTNDEIDHVAPLPGGGPTISAR
jgi:hypothetical protein